MNYTLVETPYYYEIHLTNPAKSRKDLIGKTIKHIVIDVYEIIILFEDKSCAIFNPEDQYFKDKFYSTDLHTYGFLLDQEDLDKIKALKEVKDKTLNQQRKKEQLVHYHAKVAELERELSNS